MSVEEFKVGPRQKVTHAVVGVLLETNRALSNKRIRELTGLECSRRAVCDSLKMLESAGAIEQVQSPTDGRVMLYKATESLSDVECKTAFPVHIYNNNGYRQVHHHHDGEKLSFPIHRLVAVAEYGYDEVVGKEIHHKNKHPLDNRPENLVPLEKGLHKKADAISQVKMSTSEDEFGRLLELAKSIEA